MNVEYILQQFQNKHVILVDLSWILYRSYYAFKNLSNASGEPTGQWYGLTNQLKLLSKGYPDSLILLVDDGYPAERKEINESYKANREHTVHFDNKKHIVDCLIQPLPNVYRVFNPTKEADDLMFSISSINKYNNTFTIYTTDKDLYQALKPNVYLASELDKGELVRKHIDSKQYIDNFKDLEPYQVPYYRAVLGDPSDNLKIIRPRFPSKIAYYFAKNLVTNRIGQILVLKPDTKPENLTQKQFENLLEIYSSTEFMKNLSLMKLEVIDDIPIVEKCKKDYEVQEVIERLALKQYKEWLDFNNMIVYTTL